VVHGDQSTLLFYSFGIRQLDMMHYSVTGNAASHTKYQQAHSLP